MKDDQSPNSKHVSLSPVSVALVHAFSEKEKENAEQKILVNRFVSEVASWYEKLRNSMELADESVILKNAIERILKRRTFLGGTGKTIAEPLLRELIWARYFPDNSLPESLYQSVANVIDLYLDLKHAVLAHHRISELTLNDWILDLLSAHISIVLSPDREKEAMNNYMYHFVSETIEIEDDTAETKNVQAFLAVRRAFAKDDIGFLRFHLFNQLFPAFSHDAIDEVAKAFPKAIAEINRQLNYPLKEKILVRIKRQTPIFIILSDMLKKYDGSFPDLLQKPDEFANAVFAACDVRYNDISSKVRRTIIRSVIFLLLTKVVFAFLVEGTYDNYAYGHLLVKDMIINIVSPPLLMIFASFFIKTPSVDNSRQILNKILQILFEENAHITPVLKLRLNPNKGNGVMNTVFGLLWLCAFGFSFGAIIWGLNKIGFDLVSQAVFVFFITIVSFLTYRIAQIARTYTVVISQGLLTPFIDLLFIPIVKVGMRLTDGISLINPLLIIFDFLIEAPFKTIFGFFEQLFSYLHAKREDLE